MRFKDGEPAGRTTVKIGEGNDWEAHFAQREGEGWRAVVYYDGQEVAQGDTTSLHAAYKYAEGVRDGWEAVCKR